MSGVQRFICRFLPVRWAEAMEMESRSWIVQCPCGFARSVWDWGGVRYKATGSPRWRLPCPQCGKRTWHKVFKVEMR